MSLPFLTARWRYVTMLNYACDPALLRPYVPVGTELDDYDGVTYLSIVGLLFRDTRVLGVPIPFHRNFEEINLRFYVQRRGPEGRRRGVVFIKEIVPLPAVSIAARVTYGENYHTLRTRHTLYEPKHNQDGVVVYEWFVDGRPNRMEATFLGEPVMPDAGSLTEYLGEHYWGYTKRGNDTLEYRVEHSPWRVWEADRARLDVDAEKLYGKAIANVLSEPMLSAFVAEGSAVTVRTGRSIRGADAA